MIEIRSRFTGDVIRAVDTENLSGANLSRAYLSGADLRGANLSRAYLREADLRGACLRGANLSRAELSGAKIGDYEITAWLAQLRRSDGYEFLAFRLFDGGALIRAGCRTLTLPEYRQHVAAEYPDTDKALETTAILDFIAARDEVTR